MFNAATRHWLVINVYLVMQSWLLISWVFILYLTSIDIVDLLSLWCTSSSFSRVHVLIIWVYGYILCIVPYFCYAIDNIFLCWIVLILWQWMMLDFRFKMLNFRLKLLSFITKLLALDLDLSSSGPDVQLGIIVCSMTTLASSTHTKLLLHQVLLLSFSCIIYSCWASW